MAKRCDVCGRGSTRGNNRSHSMRQTVRRQNINLQTKALDGIKLKVCSTCLKTSKKPVKVKKEVK
jgi:large subunit ribosomal protein L28